MIIDGHSHVVLPTAQHIKLMDESGIDKTVLFSTSVHPERAGNAEELAKFYPAVPVVLGHLGGSYWLEALGLAKEIPNLYLDISAWFSALVLKIVINELPHKCIFGVDLPYGDLQIGREAIEKFAKSQSVINAVLGDNMAQLLKL